MKTEIYRIQNEMFLYVSGERERAHFFFGERELSAAHFSALSEERWARSQISERLPTLSSYL